MNFEKAWKALVSGLRVRNTSWEEHEYWEFSGGHVYNQEGECVQTSRVIHYLLSGNDMFEIVLDKQVFDSTGNANMNVKAGPAFIGPEDDLKFEVVSDGRRQVKLLVADKETKLAATSVRMDLFAVEQLIEALDGWRREYEKLRELEV